MSNGGGSQEAVRVDPFQFWRQVYEANEQIWTKAVKDMVSTRDYAEAQGRMLETFLAFQKLIRDGMTAQMNILNLPTRDDVARLGELIVSLEEKVDRLDDRLHGLERAAARQPRVGQAASTAGEKTK